MDAEDSNPSVAGDAFLPYQGNDRIRARVEVVKNSPSGSGHRGRRTLQNNQL